MRRDRQRRALVFLALLGSGVIAGSGCGPSQEEYDAQVRQVNELRAELEQATQRQEEMQAQLDRLTGENNELNGQLEAMGGLRSDLAEARRIATEFQRRAAQQQARLAAFRSMLSQFQSMIDSGRLRVRIVRGRMVIELPSNILFESGDAALSDQGEQTLAEVAGVLRTIANRDFLVVGHTDNVPIRSRRFPSNWELSTQRAVNVVRYIQEQGVDPTHLSAAGAAEYTPSQPNDTEEGRAQNRRIEIVLMPNLDELPDLSSLEQEAAAD